MSRRPLIAGNWKLNLGPVAAVELADALRSLLAERGEVDVAVFPTALVVASVQAALNGTGIEVGVQDIHDAPNGAFTGSNSAVIAREVGCTRALIGHSERRTLFGDTDASVGKKVKAALGAGLLPVVCVGETLAERDAGAAEAVVHRQIAAVVEGLHEDQVGLLTIAYEPVWAIGTGRTATPDQAQEVHAAIRAWFAYRYPAWVAGGMRILYGGSVTPGNSATLLSCPDIDGALVGGASLKAADFSAIVRSAG